MNKFKAFTVLLGVLLMASMISCNKNDVEDGVYSPSKKIQKIYYSSTYYEKFLHQVWNWDGNLLASKDYYNYGEYYNYLDCTEKFTYDGGRLVRVDRFRDGHNLGYTTYEYDGKRLKSANYYLLNVDLETTTVYEYKNGKLSKVTITTYNNGYKDGEENRLKSSFLPFSAEIVEFIDRVLPKASATIGQKEASVLTLQFTWEGGNISNIEVISDGVTSNVVLQYDDKNNPEKGFLDMYALNFEYLMDGDMYYSKNNVTNMTITNSNGRNEIATLTYLYDSDDFPTMRTLQYSNDNLQIVTYYEY